MEAELKLMKRNDLRDFIRRDIPPLCEIWNWEGDLTVLPGKVKHIVNEA